MRPAGGRVGRWAVTVLLLVAHPPPCLPAQGAVVGSSGSVRSAALAGAGVALVGDAASVFANPAGLATVHHAALEGSYASYPGGATLSSGSAAVRFGRLDYGLGVLSLRPAGGGHPADLLGLSALVLRYGIIAVGTSLKYVRQNVSGRDVETWVGDAGMAIALFDIFALGASVQNLGGNAGSGVHLPRRTRVGLTMNYVDPQGPGRLLTTLEGQWPEGEPAVLVAGAEAGLLIGGIGLVARVGVTGQPASSNTSPVALGAGVELGRLRLDYAYRSLDTAAGAIHRFGARWIP